jgi:nucleoside-diphosphate-sugar epimerase
VIGVTGHTGHLGQEILRLLPDAHGIGREIPKTRFDCIIHTACANWRDEKDVALFDLFNDQLCRHIYQTRPTTVINLGSWWQYAEGNCRDLSYTLQKHRQTRALHAVHPNLVTLIPYSIYGNEPRPGRGFIPQLINTINTGQPLTGLSNQPRDFIHVSDVAAACITALTAPPGIYMIATGQTNTPRRLAENHGVTAPDYNEHPNAYPVYIHDFVPNWQPAVNVHEHIADAIR